MTGHVKTAALALAGLGIGLAVAHARRPRTRPLEFPRPGRVAYELANGNEAVIEADGASLTTGTYLRCQKPDGTPLEDGACREVRGELPDVRIPITALIRMTTGRIL